MTSVIDQLIEPPQRTIHIPALDKACGHTQQNEIIAGLSLGKKGGLNMNAFAAIKPKSWTQHYKGIVATIADGINNNLAGQQASQLSATHFITDYLDTPESWTVEQSIDRVITALNTWLFRYGAVKGHYTTHFSSLVLHQGQAHIIHLGHCQIGLIRDGNWIPVGQTPLTTEHSQSLGSRDRCAYQYESLATQPGDVFVMSTPGFYTRVSQSEVCRQVTLARSNGSELTDTAAQLCRSSHASYQDSSLLLLKVLQEPSQCNKDS
ncbi:SpoIIE family protein phosphatase [Motilimonas pumila]|uniref:PPM-type phosphatase domain-containing protein n=1 Tax=Motilimonas pumila TaxID=2303987 RepID=A0A418YFL2_9GAMM|nr:SpoIIE family protein phosphatase [Motilimonas pumila]RJG48160.1 hypothetical protein D1Z90_08825 [Motilimonas pumila]